MGVWWEQEVTDDVLLAEVILACFKASCFCVVIISHRLTVKALRVMGLDFTIIIQTVTSSI